METFDFTVKIQAVTKEDAIKILTALMDLKKSTSKDDLILFAKKIKEKPGLIQKAKLFL
jgi:hypothetical protein